MKSIAISWLTILVVAFTGLVLQADEKKDDEVTRPKPGEDGGKGKGKGKGGFEPSRIFDMIDKNDDGAISIRELGDSPRFKDASKREVAKVFKEKDLNDDGEIGKVEFAKTLGKGGRRKGGKGGKGPKGGRDTE